MKWEKQSEQKSIKEILGNLNSKLKICRQKYNRDFEGEAKKNSISQI